MDKAKIMPDEPNFNIHSAQALAMDTQRKQKNAAIEASKREEELSIARASNEISRQSNLISEKANSKSDEANHISKESNDIAKSANALSILAIATIVAIIALFKS